MVVLVAHKQWVEQLVSSPADDTATAGRGYGMSSQFPGLEFSGSAARRLTRAQESLSECQFFLHFPESLSSVAHQKDFK